MDGELSFKRPHYDASEDIDGVPASKKARPAVPSLANSRYADDRKRLLQLVQKLNAAGAQAELDIPRVVVIGNQSAGKSSVVEAISGITVPRDAGTCTRCPMECRMSEVAEPWSCRLSIRLEYDERARRKLDKVDERPFGDIITDKAQVELALRRAQFAVLNPEVAHHQILSLSLNDMKSGNYNSPDPLDFSRNVVCVDLRGPDCTALLTCPVHENYSLVELVESLVVENIKGNALILVTIPMTDDLENQKALTLARAADSEGKRTIGVLTKADAVPATSRASDNWLEVIEGRRKKLRHGYFCTRQPDDVEHNLVQKIAPLLEQVIRKCLPVLSTKTKEKLDECEKELARLPPAIKKDVVALMLELVSKLSTDTAELVKGSQGNETLIQNCRASYKQFQVTIRSTAPLFVPLRHGEKLKHSTTNSGFTSASSTAATLKTASGEQPSGSAFGAFGSPLSSAGSSTASTTTGMFGQSGSGGMFGQPASTSSTFGTGTNGAFGTSSAFKGFGTVRQNNANANAAKPVEQSYSLPPKPGTAPQPPKRTPIDRIDLTQDSDDDLPADVVSPSADAASKGMNLDEMHEHIEKSLSRELPGDVPLSAKQALIIKYQHTWEKAAQTCIDDVRKQTQNILDGLIAARFGQWDLLHGQIRAEVDSLVNRLCSSTWASASDILMAERTPMTQNEHYFEDSQRIWLERYRAQRKGPPQNVDPEAEAAMKEALAYLARAGHAGYTAESLAMRLKPDDYERELAVMAYVRGYFKVSYKRVIDNIPMLIDLKFLQQLENELQPFLLEKLNIGDGDVRERFERYFSEDEEVVARRKVLTQRKVTLEIVKMQLYKYGVSM